MFEDFIIENTEQRDIEPCIAPDMMARADEGDRYAFQQLYPFCHYILTEDYRIVEEPNFFRWGIFLEKAKHRPIDRTAICSGSERPRARLLLLVESWTKKVKKTMLIVVSDEY